MASATTMRSMTARQSFNPTIARSIRSFASAPASRAVGNSSLWHKVQPRISNVALRQVGFRFNSTGPQVTLTPKTQHKRGKFRSFVVWTWRFFYVSGIAGFLYIGYGVWDLRFPVEQEEPGPNKKTLVILGTGWGSVSLLKKLDTENYNVRCSGTRENLS